MGWKDAPEVTASPKWASAPEIEQAKPQVGKAEAAMRGGVQGLTMGWGDEAEAKWKSLFPKSMGGGDYRQIRDQLRGEEANARQQHPYIYGGAEALGSAAPAIGMAAATGGTSLVPGLARAALPIAAGQGALQGAGSSNADTTGGLVRDSSIGGGLGALGYGVGSALGSAGGALVRWARGKAALATSRAAEKAAAEVAEKIASAKGSLGGEVQKGQRLVENWRRIAPDTTPEEAAALQKLEERLTASMKESLPAQAETIASKDAELAALKSGASDTFNARKDELLSTREAGQQLKARLLRYGPVAAGTLLGSAVGGPAGTAIGALAGAGTRPMVQATLRMAKNPAVQKMLAEKLANTLESPGAMFLRLALERGAPPLATQELVTQ